MAAPSKKTKKKTLTNTTRDRKPPIVEIGVSPDIVYDEPAEVVLASAPTPPLARIRIWNKWLAFLYGAQALAIALLGVDRIVPVTTQYLAKDTLGSQVAGHPIFAPATRQLCTINVRFLVVAFLLASALASTLVAVYSAADVRGQSKIRVAGQGLSGMIIVLATALLGGMYGLPSLLAVAGLSLVAPALMLGVSSKKLSNVQSIATWVGLGADAVLWLVIAMLVFGSNFYGGAVPGFVYGVFTIAVVGRLLLATMHFLQERGRGRWAQLWRAERLFMITGLLMQTALAWLIFAGTLLHT